MAIEYTKADDEVNELISSVMKKFHERLMSAGVTVQCLVARNEVDAPAVKLHGWPCYATVRKTSLKQRVAGMADAEILIDGKEWDRLTDNERRALIDHELTHLEISEKSNGAPKIDSAGRPVLSMRPHDYELSGFKEVMKRHEDAAIEVQQAKKWQLTYEQMLLDFSNVG